MYDYSDAPQEIKNFITYMVTIRGRSKLTANEYYLDLRMFLRFMRLMRNDMPMTTDLDSISMEIKNFFPLGWNCKWK